MKKTLWLLLIIVCFPRAHSQNVEGQFIAAQFGAFQVPGQKVGAFVFPPATCQVSAGNVNFAAFAAGRPVKILDGNPAFNEVASPSSVNINACSLNMATTYTHYPPYFLTSGTGGLQEAITAAQNGNGINSILLTAEWYALIQPLAVTTVIASVHGTTGLGLVDVTQTPYQNYTWNGTQYVATGGTAGSVTYNQGAAGAVTRGSTSKWQDSISIKDFGATGGSLSLDTAGLQAAVTAAAATGKSVFVPAGTYLLNNSSAAVLSGAQNVLIWGEGPASSFVCNTVGGPDCIASTGATGFGLSSLSVSFGTTATTRSQGYAVNIQSCTRCSLADVTLNNGDLSGLRLASSVHTSIRNLRVTNFEANGTFLINNQDLTVSGLTCANNGDACFEVSWFDSQFGTYGIPCDGISASNINSFNDVEAVLINSCTNVTVNGFTSTGSAKESIFVGQDPTTTTTQWPDRISIAGGTIYGSGYGSNPLNVNTAQAAYVNVGTNPSGFISHISFSNIVATHIAGWGFQMADLQNDDVQFNNLTVYDVGNATGVGCFQTEGNNVNFSNVSCSNIGTYALFDHNTKRLTGTNFVSVAASQVSGTQAVFLDSTATGFVGINGVNVVDTNPTTFSSSVFDDSTTGQHGIFNLTTASAAGVSPLGPTSNNGGTAYTYTDVNHSYVLRNGGTIQSFLPPNVYFLPTSGTTSSAQVNGTVLYLQSKCRATPTGAEQTESTGWGLIYPTLTTASWFINHVGGCGFPLTVDMTAASSALMPQINSTGTLSGQHVSGYAAGSYVAAPTFAAGAGAGTGPTLSLNANSNDLSGYLSVTTGTSPSVSATVATGTFGVAYATLAKCGLWPANAAASALTGAAKVYVPVGSATAFSITSGATALAASTLYTWGYVCTQ